MKEKKYTTPMAAFNAIMRPWTAQLKSSFILRFKPDIQSKKAEQSYKYRMNHPTNKFVIGIAMERGCFHCGNNCNFLWLQFHHVYPDQKKFELNSTKAKAYPMEQVREEIQKCVVVCANCHLMMESRMFRDRFTPDILKPFMVTL